MQEIKSKERVKKHGEVFTPDSIVNDMLDLVDAHTNNDTEWSYIDSTVLEPSCGNGNFLIRILERKLQHLQQLNKEQWRVGLLRCLSSIYAVDIQLDNVLESRERILNLIKTGTTEVLELKYKDKKGFDFEPFVLDEELELLVKFILEHNILHGNCLTGMKCDDSNEETVDDLIILEYNWNNEDVTIEEFTLNSLNNDTLVSISEVHNTINYKQLLNFNSKVSIISDDYDF